MEQFNVWVWMKVILLLGQPMVLLFLFFKLCNRYHTLETRLRNMKIKKEKVKLKTEYYWQILNEYATYINHCLELPLLETLSDLEKIVQKIDYYQKTFEEKIIAGLVEINDTKFEQSPVTDINKTKSKQRSKLTVHKLNPSPISGVKNTKSGHTSKPNQYKINPSLELNRDEIQIFMESDLLNIKPIILAYSTQVMKPSYTYNQDNIMVNMHEESSKIFTINLPLLVDFTNVKNGSPKLIVGNKNKTNPLPTFSKEFNASTFMSNVRFKIAYSVRRLTLKIPIETRNEILMALCLVKWRNGKPEFTLKAKGQYTGKPLDSCKSHFTEIDIAGLRKKKQRNPLHSIHIDQIDSTICVKKSNSSLMLKSLQKGDCNPCTHALDEKLLELCEKECKTYNEKHVLNNCVDLSKLCETNDINKHRPQEIQTYFTNTGALTVIEGESEESHPSFDDGNREIYGDWTIIKITTSSESDLNGSRFEYRNTRCVSTFSEKSPRSVHTPTLIAIEEESEGSHLSFDERNVEKDDDNSTIETRSSESDLSGSQLETRNTSSTSSFCEKSSQSFDGENTEDKNNEKGEPSQMSLFNP